MGLALKSRKESFNFYESFSDLLFNTLVLFLVLIVGLILLINSEIKRVQQKDAAVQKELEEAQKITERLRNEEAALDVRKKSLQQQNDTLVKQQEGITQEIQRQTAQFQRDAQQAEEMARQAKQQAEQTVQAAEKSAKVAEERVDKAREALAAFVGMKGPMKNVVILVDLSGSMVGGYNASGQFVKDPGRIARFERVKEEISLLIEHLDFERFNLIGFGGQESVNSERLERTASKLVAATDQTRKMAKEQLARWKVVGGTPTLPALQAAFEDPQVDTILLYTDGDPSIPNCSQQAVIDWINANNRQRKVIVNCVGIGAYDAAPLPVNDDCSAQQTMSFVDFLRQLSSAGGGSFSAR